MKTIFLLSLAAALFWAAGVRVHPESFAPYAEILLKKDYRRVEVRGGSFFMGEFISEDARELRLRTSEGILSVPASTIRKTRQLLIHEVFEALRRGEVPGSPEKEPIEWDVRENRLQPLLEFIQKNMSGQTIPSPQP